MIGRGSGRGPDPDTRQQGSHWMQGPIEGAGAAPLLLLPYFFPLIAGPVHRARDESHFCQLLRLRQPDPTRLRRTIIAVSPGKISAA